MNGRLTLLTAVAISTVFAVVWVCDREPDHNGKKASEWADIYATHSENGAVSTDSLKGREAIEAIRAMRAKLLPRALKLICYQKPEWKMGVEWFMESRMNVRKWAPAWIWHPFYGDPADLGSTYFEMLGPEAKLAIPELIQAINHSDSPRVSERATYALSYIGKEGLPPLMKFVADPQSPNRRSAVWAIASMNEHGIDVNPTVPLLIERLKDSDPDFAATAAIVLGKLGLQPDSATPALAECLQGTNGNLLYCVAEALREFGEKARPSIPRLALALRDSDSVVREAATNVLQTIAPEALGDLTRDE